MFSGLKGPNHVRWHVSQFSQMNLYIHIKTCVVQQYSSQAQVPRRLCLTTLAYAENGLLVLFVGSFGPSMTSSGSPYPQLPYSRAFYGQGLSLLGPIGGHHRSVPSPTWGVTVGPSPKNPQTVLTRRGNRGTGLRRPCQPLRGKARTARANTPQRSRIA